jgi:hypothetical protein
MATMMLGSSSTMRTFWDMAYLATCLKKDVNALSEGARSPHDSLQGSLTQFERFFFGFLRKDPEGSAIKSLNLG